MRKSWKIADQRAQWRKGTWTSEEDNLLTEYVKSYGEGRWSSVAKSAGLSRSGKSCRQRWVNYLRPGLKRGQITPQEQGIIIELHALWGNKWSTIARYLPGRTDNEIKNYWRTHFKNRAKPAEKQERKYTRRPQQEKQQLQEKNNMNEDIVEAKVRNEPQLKSEADVKDLTSSHSSLPMTFQEDVVSFWLNVLETDGVWNFDQHQPHCIRQQPSGYTKTVS